MTIKGLDAEFKKRGFAFFGDASISCDCEDDEPDCNDWEIHLYAPNGGILAVEIICRETSQCWDYPTHTPPEGFPVFGYLEEDEIMEFAKDTIWQVEESIGRACKFEFEWHSQKKSIFVKPILSRNFVTVSWCPIDASNQSEKLYTPEVCDYFQGVLGTLYEMTSQPCLLDGWFENVGGFFCCKLSAIGEQV